MVSRPIGNTGFKGSWLESPRAKGENEFKLIFPQAAVSELENKFGSTINELSLQFVGPDGEIRECSHYNVEYEEVIVFWDYETFTREYCDEGHDVVEGLNTGCPDYDWKENSWRIIICIRRDNKWNNVLD